MNWTAAALQHNAGGPQLTDAPSTVPNDIQKVARKLHLSARWTDDKVGKKMFGHLRQKKNRDQLNSLMDLKMRLQN